MRPKSKHFKDMTECEYLCNMDDFCLGFYIFHMHDDGDQCFFHDQIHTRPNLMEGEGYCVIRDSSKYFSEQFTGK